MNRHGKQAWPRLGLERSVLAAGAFLIVLCSYCFGEEKLLTGSEAILAGKPFLIDRNVAEKDLAERLDLKFIGSLDRPDYFFRKNDDLLRPNPPMVTLTGDDKGLKRIELSWPLDLDEEKVHVFMAHVLKVVCNEKAFNLRTPLTEDELFKERRDVKNWVAIPATAALRTALRETDALRKSVKGFTGRDYGYIRTEIFACFGSVRIKMQLYAEDGERPKIHAVVTPGLWVTGIMPGD